jgi:hypothetical protein
MITSTEARMFDKDNNESGVALVRLASDGFIVQSVDTWKTTRSWQREMARTAAMLYMQGDPGEDLRVPIAHVLIAFYDGKVDEDLLIDLVEAILPIELASLGLAGRSSA